MILLESIKTVLKSGLFESNPMSDFKRINRFAATPSIIAFFTVSIVGGMLVVIFIVERYFVQFFSQFEEVEWLLFPLLCISFGGNNFGPFSMNKIAPGNFSWQKIRIALFWIRIFTRNFFCFYQKIKIFKSRSRTNRILCIFCA